MVPFQFKTYQTNDKKPIYHKDIDLNMHAPIKKKKRPSKSMKQKQRSRRNRKSTFTVGDFGSTFSVIDETCIIKDIQNLNNTINQLDLIDISQYTKFSTVKPTSAKYFSSAHRIFIKT